MEDVALHQRRTERRKPRLRVKRDGVVLRVERDPCEAAGARIADERVEQVASDAPSAICRQHGHPSDLRRRRLEAVIASGRDGLIAIPNQRVPRIGIGTIVFLYVVYEAFAAKRVAGDNPWGVGATTLEWTLPSPPAFHSYDTLPRVTGADH